MVRAPHLVLFPADLAPGLHAQVMSLCRSAGFSAAAGRKDRVRPVITAFMGVVQQLVMPSA